MLPAPAVTNGLFDAERLETWAQGCDNPTGQRAAMARAIAQLRRIAPLGIS